VPSSYASSEYSGLLLDINKAVEHFSAGLNDSRDFPVPSQNLPAVKAGLTAAGNEDLDVIELPGLNHLFQTCQKCTCASMERW
jgi:hypothetical protein